MQTRTCNMRQLFTPTMNFQDALRSSFTFSRPLHTSPRLSALAPLRRYLHCHAYSSCFFFFGERGVRWLAISFPCLPPPKFPCTICQPENDRFPVRRRFLFPDIRNYKRSPVVLMVVHATKYPSGDRQKETKRRRGRMEATHRPVIVVVFFASIVQSGW
jgi:hypothetical protein